METFVAPSLAPSGTVYLIHFDPPYHHAKHYCGFTTRDVDTRLSEHVRGCGSPLVKAAHDAGCRLLIERVYHGTRWDERTMKNRHRLGDFCQRCNPNLTGQHTLGI